MALARFVHHYIFFLAFFSHSISPSLVFWCLFCATTMGHVHAIDTVTVLMAALRRDAMHQWCRGGVAPYMVVSLVVTMFWGVRSSRVVSTLMPKCGLGRVTLTRVQLNPKKIRKCKKRNNYCCLHHFLIHAPFFPFWA